MRRSHGLTATFALVAVLAFCSGASAERRVHVSGPISDQAPVLHGDVIYDAPPSSCHGHCGHHRRHHARHRQPIEGMDPHFNCTCNGSYNYPVPPLYTYHWPGIYKQQLMTDYHYPYRFPPLKPFTELGPPPALEEAIEEAVKESEEVSVRLTPVRAASARRARR